VIVGVHTLDHRSLFKVGPGNNRPKASLLGSIDLLSSV
jgi:hypothetical protein